MSVLPLAQFLQHFDAPEPVMEEPEAEIVAAFDIEPEPALPSLEEQLEVSRSAGLEEGRAAAQAEYELQLEQERQDFETRLASEKEAWMDSVAHQMVERLEKSLVDLQEATARSLVVILEPFLTQAVRDRAIGEAIAQIGRLMEADGHALLRVSGPSNLIERIRAAFPGRLSGVEFVTSEAADVTCLARDTVIETRLRDWLDALSPTEGSA